MTTPTRTVPPAPSDDGSDIPPLWFTVPDGLFALPMAPTPEERGALAHAFVRELYSRGDESLWTPAAPITPRSPSTWRTKAFRTPPWGSSPP